MSLTDEDKRWISSQLQEIGTRVSSQIQEVRTQIQEVRTELRGEIEATETRLLRAFHDWASPVEMRARSHSAALRAMDIEIEALSDRVSKLEPPH